jgi:hypothetical protein
MVDEEETAFERRRRLSKESTVRQEMKRESLDYLTERDDMLRSLSVERFFAFCVKWGYRAKKMTMLSAEKGPGVALHFMRVDLDTFNDEEKNVSARWLIAHGHSLPEPYRFEAGRLQRGGKS